MGAYAEDTFWNRVKGWIKRPYYLAEDAWMRISIIYHYIPMIWRDYDYDWGCALRMLQFKIRRMRIYMKRHGHHTDIEEQCQEMKEVEDNIERILSDDYEMDVVGEYFDKYPPSWAPTDDPRFVERVEPVPTPQDKRTYDNASKRREQMNASDWKLLWATLEKNMRKWWD